MYLYAMFRRRRTARTGVVAALLLVGSAVVAIVVVTQLGADSAVSWVIGTFSIVGLSGLWLAWASYRDDRRDAETDRQLQLDGIADRLSEAIFAQWATEAARHRLNQSTGLTVRWQPAPSDLFDDWSSLEWRASGGEAGWPPAPAFNGILRRRRGTWGAAPADLAKTGDDLVQALYMVPTKRLVMLGEPGSGKTTLLVRLTLDLLARRGSGDPVPFLVSLASWHPSPNGTRFMDWLEARLIFSHPGLAGDSLEGTPSSRARALLDAGLIVPLLDGLDELPALLRRQAVVSINDEVRPGQGFVIAARSDAYKDTVRAAVDGERLKGSAGIELQPLPLRNVEAYLRAFSKSMPTADQWDQVFAAVAACPYLTETFRNPLFVSLARDIYSPRAEGHISSADPTELLMLQSEQEVQHHLFDSYIRAAYRRQEGGAHTWDCDPKKAERWLINLAKHLENNDGGTADIAWWRLPLAAPRVVRIAAAITAGLLVGLTTGIVIVVALAAAITKWLNLDVGTASLAGFWFGTDLGRWPSFGAALLVTVAVLRTPWPVLPAQRLRWRLTRAKVLVGLGKGLSAGFLLALLVGSLVGAVFGLGVALVVGVEVAIIYGLIPGLLAGLGLGLAAGFEAAPVNISAAVSPDLVLARDRAAFRTIVATVSFASIAVAGLAFGVVIGRELGIFLGSMIGVVIGTIIALSAGVCAGLRGTSWGWTVIAHAWLAARGQLPWRLMHFLADAHEKRGVLRQVGPVYQFRHIELQHHLARR